jgi:hypothetical protein
MRRDWSRFLPVQIKVACCSPISALATHHEAGAEELVMTQAMPLGVPACPSGLLAFALLSPIEILKGVGHRAQAGKLPTQGRWR